VSDQASACGEKEVSSGVSKQNSRGSHSIWYTTDTVLLDYTTVGHVTADVMADGSRRVGGGAFYSALQAARLGRRTLIITKGVPEEIEQLLAPYRGELELQVIPSAQTTTLATLGTGSSRSQRVLAWAGPIDGEIAIDTAILHLAPVARETPRSWRGSAEFVGLTPQGLVRVWGEPGSQIQAAPLDAALLPEQLDAIVIGESERDSCAVLLADAEADEKRAPEAARSALVAMTAEHAPTLLQLPGGETVSVEVPAIEQLCDDLGAGDVFAAALFVTLGEGQAPRDAVAFANAAAAVRIAGAGADAIGDRGAVLARLASVS
jgi:sugar/nucleoside kinase (ribokinase family)